MALYNKIYRQQIGELPDAEDLKEHISEVTGKWNQNINDAIEKYVPEPIRELTSGVARVISEGLFDPEEGLLRGSSSNVLGLRPVDALRVIDAVTVKAPSALTGIDEGLIRKGYLVAGAAKGIKSQFKTTTTPYINPQQRLTSIAGPSVTVKPLTTQQSSAIVNSVFKPKRLKTTIADQKISKYEASQLANRFIQARKSTGAAGITLSGSIHPGISGQPIIGESEWLPNVKYHTESSLAPVQDFKGSDQRFKAAEFTTGQKLTTSSGKPSRLGREIDRIWTQEGQIEYVLNHLEKIPALRAVFPKSTIHHPGAVKTVAAALNGLSPQMAMEGGEYIASKLKGQQALGYIQKGIPLPAKQIRNNKGKLVTLSPLHNRIHALLNEWLGPNKELMRYVEALDGQPIVSKEIWDRKEAFDRVADAINDADSAIAAFYENLEVRSKFFDQSITPQRFLESQLEIAKYDKRFKQIASRKIDAVEGRQNLTLTDIVNDIVKRTNVALEASVNLTKSTSSRDVLYDILIQDQGWLALREAVTSGESAASIFKKYKIEIKNPITVREAVKEIDPNELLQYMSIADIDTYIQTGWYFKPGSANLPVKTKPISLPPKASNMSRDQLEQFIRSGWTVLDDNGKPIDPLDYIFKGR